MRRLVRVADIYRIPSTELMELWRQDFQVLVTTAIADTQGRVHPVVADMLRSAEWCHDWYDALMAAEGELASAHERMAYSGDLRAGATKKRLMRIRTVRDEARVLHRDRMRTEGQNNPAAVRVRQADSVAMAWLRHHHKDWCNVRRGELLRERGMAENRPGYGMSPADGVEAIENAAREGTIPYPSTPEVEALLDLGDEQFRNQVARDIQEQDFRIQELRHPLLLNDWMAALQELEAMTLPLAWAENNSESMTLGRLDVAKLAALPSEEAYKVLRARRFCRALYQRIAEWKRIVRRMARDVAALEEAIARPWYDVEQQVRQELVDKFPEQYSAMRRALDPFGVRPGSNQLDVKKFDNKLRGKVKQIMLDALADGSWVRLLT